MSKMKVISIFVVLVTFVASETVDYCNKDLCKNYVKHIACNNDGYFASTCPTERSLVPMTTELRNLILKLHNSYRCDIATGRVPGYQQASQMIEMTWHPELAKLAELKVKTCIFEHDKCRSTYQYRKPGQNLGVVKTSPDYKDIVAVVYNHTGEWFIEYKDCDMSYINKYRSSIFKIGHFTQLATAGADRVGCAMSKYNIGKKYVLFACNYSLGNIDSQPVYKTGKPCSNCKSGCSKNYPGLCNSNEKSFWDPNEI